MKKKRLDINCDVGEGIGNEARLFPYITSCNIACGGHAGDAKSMQEIVRLSKRHSVKIGAHPSYPDKLNFGRVSLDMPVAEFRKSIQEQLSALQQVINEESATLHHIKPHGALYNDLVKTPDLVKVFLHMIAAYQPSCYLYVPFGSVIAREANLQGFRIIYEAFGDRRYLTASQLVPRQHPGAVIQDPQEVLEQLISMFRKGQVKTLDGTVVPLKADTFCIHGDTPSALQILTYLAGELPKYGIYLKE